MQQYQPNLGELCKEDARRDAVHIAVAPVVAGEILEPGSHVEMIGGAAYCSANAIGVVDPFLQSNLNAGETFWLFLYPNTVTSLRHIWTHSSFTIKLPEGTP